MIPFTRRIDPGLARFLVSTCRGVVVVASVFSVAVAAILVASVVQLAVVKPLDNPGITALRDRYRASPEDASLAEDIRTLDLAARRLYFTRQWQIRSAGVMLVVGAALVLAGLRLAGSLVRQLPKPLQNASEEAAMGTRSIRIALGVMAVVLLLGGLTAAALVTRLAGSLAGGSAGAAEGGTRAAAGTAAGAAASILTDEMTANWPQLRGPGGNGVAEKEDPPVDWDGRSRRNIAWSVRVPLPGRGSPVVWGDHVYLSGADQSSREVYCWNTATGVLAWKQSIPLAPGAPAWPPRVDKTAGYAASTMAANGKAVFAMFANGDLTALSHDGRILWARAGGELRMNYGYAASPAVTGDAVIAQIDQEEKGTLLALRAEDGSVLWETPRTVSSSWASPTVVQEGGRWMVLAQGTPILAAYDAQKGKAIWQTPGMMGENAPSPAAAAGRVFAANQLLSMSAVDAKTGKVLWETYDGFPDVASPLATGDVVLMAASYGLVTCLDAASGNVLWKEELGTGFYASPLVAAGRFYLVDRSGVMRIFAAERTKKLVGSPALGEPVDATPAFHDGAIYIRGSAHLFRIGGGAGAK